MLQAIVLIVTPGAPCSARPIVPTSPSWPDDGGGEQAGSVAARKLETRIALRAWLRSVGMGPPSSGVVVCRNVVMLRTERSRVGPSSMQRISRQRRARKRHNDLRG